MQKKKDLNYKQKLSHSRLRKQPMLVLLLGLGRWLWLLLGLGLLWLWLLLLLGRKLTNRYRRQFKTVTKRKTQLPQWVHRFLRDEEKAAILLDYRIRWYGRKRPNKWIRFKVWLKTNYYIFYEIRFKQFLYENITQKVSFFEFNKK